MSHHFFAFLSRMRHIHRWGLMRNTYIENDLEHSCQVAQIAQALAQISILRYGGDVDAGKVAQIALYHEVSEVITGDMPSPIKYASSEMCRTYKQFEKNAIAQMLTYLPEDLRPAYEELLLPDESSAEWRFVKAADKICAYLKCLEEKRANNSEFDMALANLTAQVKAIDMPEAQDFIRDFAGSFSLPLDAINS